MTSIAIIVITYYDLVNSWCMLLLSLL